MTFDRFENCLNSVAGNEVKLDIVLDLLNCVMEDAVDKNNAANIYDIPYDDASDVAQSLLLFSNVMISLIDHLDKDQLAGLQAGIISANQKYLETVVPEFEALEAQSREVEDSKNKAEEKKAELDKQHRELDAERGHLLHVQEDCNRLQAEIDRLNDPYLDELAAQKAQLEQTVQQKKEKEQELQSLIATHQSELAAVQAQLAQSDADLEASRQKFDTLSEKVGENKKTKAGLEEGIRHQREALEDFEKWRQEFDEKNRALVQATHQINEVINACNAIVKNDALIKNIDAQKAIDYSALTDEDQKVLRFNGRELTGVNDLQAYLDTLTVRMDALLEICKSVLKAFQEKAKAVLNNEKNETNQE